MSSCPCSTKPKRFPRSSPDCRMIQPDRRRQRVERRICRHRSPTRRRSSERTANADSAPRAGPGFSPRPTTSCASWTATAHSTGPTSASRRSGARRRRGPRPGRAALCARILADTRRRRESFSLAWELSPPYTRSRLTDLGPMRAMRRLDLLALGIEDRRFGWPLEMVLAATTCGLAHPRGGRELRAPDRAIQSDGHAAGHRPCRPRHGEGAAMKPVRRCSSSQSHHSRAVSKRGCARRARPKSRRLAEAALWPTPSQSLASTPARRHVIALDGPPGRGSPPVPCRLPAWKRTRERLRVHVRGYPGTRIPGRHGHTPTRPHSSRPQSRRSLNNVLTPCSDPPSTADGGASDSDDRRPRVRQRRDEHRTHLRPTTQPSCVRSDFAHEPLRLCAMSMTSTMRSPVAATAPDTRFARAVARSRTAAPRHEQRPNDRGLAIDADSRGAGPLPSLRALDGRVASRPGPTMVRAGLAGRASPPLTGRWPGARHRLRTRPPRPRRSRSRAS